MYRTVAKKGARFVKGQGLVAKKTAQWTTLTEDGAREAVATRYDSMVVESVLRQVRSGHPIDLGWGWLEYTT